VDFTALRDEFGALNAVVVGMSPDTAASHDKFVAKQALHVILAADPEKTVLEAYGVWQEKMNYGRKYMGVVRTTYLIGEDGKVLNTWSKVRAKGHAEAVLAYLQNLD
jgi:peroxiredoxin Q/BCP